MQGFYLRNAAYSEAGAIAGRFTYQRTRQTLEMTTFYNRSVAVDQMRLIAPNVRLRTIVTYQRPRPHEIPSVIDLIGFGVEHKQSA
ncbi:phycobiliprotein lyase [Trichocoleus desertorum]|uniref:phycobiliprotein lyase n=1 Tax=Trichocoleus desertorum TaxID=1481672 RepID=UPI0032986BF8